MTTSRQSTKLITVLGMLAGVGVLLAAPAQAAAPPKAAEAVRVCTKCHDESDKKPVLAILKTKHAVVGDKRTPFADQACITCHGKSENHLKEPAKGEKRLLPDIAFGKTSTTSSVDKNGVCLTCHENSLRMSWKGSPHETQDLNCASCHTVHTGKDPTLVKITQPETCFNCHKDRRAQIFRPSTHPIKEGKVSCSDCHNPHGGTGPKQLARGTVNETCYTCHAEKRGPFLWEHEPVREDCTICHEPHGSVHNSLLKVRGPWLCQQCHMVQFHPSTAYSGTGLPTTKPSGAQQMLLKNCMNCHSQVHGSNHPSGVRKTR